VSEVRGRAPALVEGEPISSLALQLRIVAGGLVELFWRAIVQSEIRRGGWRAPLVHALLFWGARARVVVSGRP
jgi:hypothetical protein